MPYGDLGTSVVMAQTLKLAYIMEKALNEEQQKRSLAIFAKDPKGVLAIGITEPDNASNYIIPYPTAMRTTGERAKGGWVVDGNDAGAGPVRHHHLMAPTPAWQAPQLNIKLADFRNSVRLTPSEWRKAAASRTSFSTPTSFM